MGIIPKKGIWEDRFKYLKICNPVLFRIKSGLVGTLLLYIACQTPTLRKDACLAIVERAKSMFTTLHHILILKLKDD